MMWTSFMHLLVICVSLYFSSLLCVFPSSLYDLYTILRYVYSAWVDSNIPLTSLLILVYFHFHLLPSSPAFLEQFYLSVFLISSLILISFSLSFYIRGNMFFVISLRPWELFIWSRANFLGQRHFVVHSSCAPFPPVFKQRVCAGCFLISFLW